MNPLRWLIWRFGHKRTLIAMRLENMYLVHPNMVINKCSECAKAVGVYPSGQDVLRRYRQVKLICHICGQDILYLGSPAPGIYEDALQSLPKKR